DLITQARDQLNAGVQEWGRQLAAFWKEWPQFDQDAGEYAAYAQELEEVVAAWDVIARRWGSYEQAYAQYTELVAQRQERIDAQNEARAAFEEAVARCTEELE